MQVGKMEDNSELRERIMFYESEFDLVLLAERFDESLVVMKEVLCWDLQDIMYLKVRNHISTLSIPGPSYFRLASIAKRDLPSIHLLLL